MMKLIRQKNGIDCGFAVAAMLAGTTYAKAEKADPHPWKTTGLSVSDFVEIVSACSGKTWKTVVPKRKPLIDCGSCLPDFGALIIRAHSKIFGHWIAIENGVIYDPEMRRTTTIENYERGIWLLIRIIVPAK